MTLETAIKDDLKELLESQGVEVLTPRKRMLELKSVPVGAEFSKPCTNLLLWHRDVWRMFVDDDLSYAGDDSGFCEMLPGPSRKRWQPLTPGDNLVGDANGVLLAALELLNSPLKPLVETLCGPPAQRSEDDDDTEFELRPAWYAELLDVTLFDGAALQPTRAQAAAIERVVVSAMRQETPVCPVLCGESGSGKSTAARLAAERLVQKGAIGDVFVISGASMHAGIAYESERDERLTEAFSVSATGANPLVIIEQMDLLLSSSRLVKALVADVIDRGIRLIGVAQPEFDPRRLRGGGSLGRRLELIWLEGAHPAEMLGVLAKRLEDWPIANELEVMPEAVAAAIALSARRGAVEPASSMGLLESVLIEAGNRGLKIVGPDEVFHMEGRVADESGGGF